MKESRTMWVALVLCVLAFSIGLVTADPAAPGSLNTISSSSRDESQFAAQSINAQGGNVTQVNINALTITNSWQGYYGQVSGEITLDDSSSSTFYNWSMATVSGEVYGTRNNTVTWSQVVCANTTHFGQEQTALGQGAGDGDTVGRTFNLQSHPAVNVGSRLITANSCNSTYAFSNNASQTTNWVQILLHQNDTNPNNIIYTTIINDSTVGFNGGVQDFQLMVGENEHAGSEGVTTYYFWVELG